MEKPPNSNRYITGSAEDRRDVGGFLDDHLELVRLTIEDKHRRQMRAEGWIGSEEARKRIADPLTLKYKAAKPSSYEMACRKAVWDWELARRVRGDMTPIESKDIRDDPGLVDY